MLNPKQQTDPQEFPLEALERLCAAVNEVNDSFRAYAQAWDVDMKGQSYFSVAENMEIQAAIFEKSKQFFTNGLAVLLLAARPAAGGKPQ
jgi:hypothetical protein